jgi:hypothetical protein
MVPEVRLFFLLQRRKSGLPSWIWNLYLRRYLPWNMQKKKRSGKGSGNVPSPEELVFGRLEYQFIFSTG